MLFRKRILFYNYIYCYMTPISEEGRSWSRGTAFDCNLDSVGSILSKHLVNYIL